MNWSKFYLLSISLVILSSCNSHKTEELIELNKSNNHVIEVIDLQKIMENDSIVILDVRKPEEYQTGHLPRAINIWRPDIQEDSLPYGGMMASKIKMENLFSNLGIKNNNYLVLYDNKGSCDATRLWWILDYYGFQNVALLNGGLKEWVKEDSLSNDSPTRNKSQFKLSNESFNDRTISLEELYNAISDSSLVIIDSRSLEEYSGEHLKKGAFDKGRILGSINIDWTETVNYKSGTFKTKEEIKGIYAAKGIDSTSNVVVYCHSGVRSAHTTFVLTELLGYKNVKNYDGSWIQWSYLKLPIERD